MSGPRALFREAAREATVHAMLDLQGPLAVVLTSCLALLVACSLDSNPETGESDVRDAELDTVGQSDVPGDSAVEPSEDAGRGPEPDPEPDLPAPGAPLPECETGQWQFGPAVSDSLAFTDVTAAIGLPEIYGDSVAWGDLNGDLRPDLMMLWSADNDDVTSRIRAEAYLNCPGQFVPIGLMGRIDSEILNNRGAAVAIADIDGDGRADFVSGSVSTAHVSYQEANGSFTAAQIWEGDLEAHPSLGYTGSVVSDIDGDGLLDIYLNNYVGRNELLMNEGARVLENRSADFPLLEQAGDIEVYASAHIFSPMEPGRSFLYVSAHGAPHGDRVFEVLPSPEFREVMAVTAPRSSMGIDYIHVTRENTALAVTDTGNLPSYYFRNGRLEPSINDAIFWEDTYNQWGVRFGDFDNDGWQDMVFAGGVPNADPEFAETWGVSTTENPVAYFRGVPADTMTGMTWTEQVGEGGPALDGTVTGNFYSTVSADFDYDGCLDLAVSPLTRFSNRPPREFWDAPIRVLRNNCGTENHWIGVQVADDPGAIMTMFAFREGEAPREFIREVQAAAGNGNSNFTQQLHVGLGELDQIQSVEFRCRDGRVVELDPSELEVGTWHSRPDICAAE